jgi:hypothetical protein
MCEMGKASRRPGEIEVQTRVLPFPPRSGLQASGIEESTKRCSERNTKQYRSSFGKAAVAR